MAGPNNSGISVDFQPDLATSAAAVEALIPATMARVEARQAQSAQFIAEWGAEVLDGHHVVDDVPPGDGTPMSGPVFDPTWDS